MNNLPELRKIIADAPDGCTHHATKSNKYFMIDGWRMHVWLGEVWSVPISNELDVLIVGDVRPLSDLRTMVEQYERIAKLETIVREVAHVGVDFGYGKYCLEPPTIDDARKLMEHEL